MAKTLLIVPCYNEARRLDLQAFANASPDISYLFADDGSTDETVKILTDFAASSPRYQVYQAPQNLGKANVIQSAYQEISSRQNMQDYDWIGFWDADLATPLEAVEQMLKFAQEFYPMTEVAAIWGSRISRMGSDIRRQAHRHYLGRMFITVVSMLLGVSAYDTQCGAKLFRPQAAAVAFSQPFLSRWIFDIEIFLRIKGMKIVEFPLMKWIDVPGSKLKIFKEIFRVAKDILLIRKEYL